MNSYKDVREWLDKLNEENAVFEEGYDMGFAHGRETGYNEGVWSAIAIVLTVGALALLAIIMGWVIV